MCSSSSKCPTAPETHRSHPSPTAPEPHQQTGASPANPCHHLPATLPPCHLPATLPATFQPRRRKGGRGTPALPSLPAKPSLVAQLVLAHLCARARAPNVTGVLSVLVPTPPSGREVNMRKNPNGPAARKPGDMLKDLKL